MPHRAAVRQERMKALHESTNSIIEGMRVLKAARVPIQAKNNITKSLIELKRNQDMYGFGKNQKKLLDMLIKKSRAVKTHDDLLNIHKLTCGLGLEKDL